VGARSTRQDGGEACLVKWAACLELRLVILLRNFFCFFGSAGGVGNRLSLKQALIICRGGDSGGS